MKANISDMTAALALKANIKYVENQLTFKDHQTTTYMKTEVDDLLRSKPTITYIDLKNLFRFDF